METTTVKDIPAVVKAVGNHELIPENAYGWLCNDAGDQFRIEDGHLVGSLTKVRTNTPTEDINWVWLCGKVRIVKKTAHLGRHWVEEQLLKA